MSQAYADQAPRLDDKSRSSLSSTADSPGYAASRTASSAGSRSQADGDDMDDSQSRISAQWSIDGGIRIAGGPHGGDAPSIDERQGFKDRLPPPYQAYPSA